MKIRDRLDELGLDLPPAFVYPSENRTGCVVTRYLLYTSGHPPPENFGVKVKGKVGADVSEEEAYAAARALMDSDKNAEEIARRAMEIAGDICVYTNSNIVIETLELD